MQARTVYNQLQDHLSVLFPPTPPPKGKRPAIWLPRPPTFNSGDKTLLARWRQYLKWEESNPLLIEESNKNTCVQRRVSGESRLLFVVCRCGLGSVSGRRRVPGRRLCLLHAKTQPQGIGRQSGRQGGRQEGAGEIGAGRVVYPYRTEYISCPLAVSVVCLAVLCSPVLASSFRPPLNLDSHCSCIHDARYRIQRVLQATGSSRPGRPTKFPAPLSSARTFKAPIRTCWTPSAHGSVAQEPALTRVPSGSLPRRSCIVRALSRRRPCDLQLTAGTETSYRPNTSIVIRDSRIAANLRVVARRGTTVQTADLLHKLSASAGPNCAATRPRNSGPRQRKNSNIIRATTHSRGSSTAPPARPQNLWPSTCTVGLRRSSAALPDVPR